MSGRARARRICQAALGALIDPKKAAYDLVKDETGELFDRWFPEQKSAERRLLDAVLRDVAKAYPDLTLGENLTEKAQALLAMHGLSREELAGPGIKLDAQRAVERVCVRGLKIVPPGLHEANRSFDGRLPPVEIEASIEQPLRQLVWSFYNSLIKNLDEELQVAIFGRTLDLLEGIDRKLDSLTRPAKGPPALFSIPQPVGDFTGYEDEIAAVQAALAEGSAAISAVQGIGGVGKTELAREVARRMRGEFPDGQILVDMLGTTQPREARDAMTDVLVALGATDIRPDTLAAEYHSRLAGKRVLILLDNVASGAGLQELVPPEPAALLVTSRTRFAMAGVNSVELEKLSRDAAKALLGGIVPGLDDATLDALAGLCADLPLALRVAGAYLQETGYPADAYIEELSERRLTRLARSATAIEDVKLDPEVVLGHSYDRLVEANAELAKAFTLLSVFPADFEAAGAAAVLGMEPDEARERLTLLRRRSLVQQPEGGARWRLHDLLRELAEERAAPAERQEAAARHRAHYLALLDWAANEHTNERIDVRRALSMFEAELPNITAAINDATAAADLPTTALAHLATGLLASALGRREDALSATKEAVDLYRDLAEDQPDTFGPQLAGCLNNLGKHLSDLGRREDALLAAEEAVVFSRRLARDEPNAFNPYLAVSLTCICGMLNDLGRHEDARVAAEEAVDLCRRLADDRPDAFRPDLAASLGNLGNSLDALGLREEALLAAEEAVGTLRLLAQGRPDSFNLELAQNLDSLGNKLHTLGRYREALNANEEAVELYRCLAQDQPDALNPDLASSLSNLSIKFDALGRRENALSASEEAVAIQRNLAVDWPDTFNPLLASSLINMGTMLARFGRPEDAFKATKETVVLYRRLAQDRPYVFNPDLAISLNNLSIMLNALGQREDALQAIKKAVAINRRLAADRPEAYLPHLANSLAIYGNCLEGLSRLDEALASNLEAIETLLPAFLRLPHAVMHWMGPMCQQYVARCQKLGIEPDAELLGPIVEVFERLQAEDG